jgi:exoribonuclease-2
MEIGNIVEYIDARKIVTAVILDVKGQRIRILSESNKEGNLSMSRLSHSGRKRIDVSIGRNRLLEILKETAAGRREVARSIDIRELWEILHSEQEWIDVRTMAAFCFSDPPSEDEEAAVVRAFFGNRVYFKFKPEAFFPNSPEEVEKILHQEWEAERRNRVILEGGDWLAGLKKGTAAPPPGEMGELERILKSTYLFEKESPHYATGREILARAGVDMGDPLFRLLIKAGLWRPDENIDLLRMQIPTEFPPEVLETASRLECAGARPVFDDRRRDLTDLPLITIDGQATHDFDDAISIENRGDHHLLGVHIADVGHFIEKGGEIDREAIARGSSIYMPDRKVPMVPPSMAEGLCSLIAMEMRPAISVMIRLDPEAEVLGYEIFPSRISVKHQLTYYDVNLMADQDPRILSLHDIARKFRRKRLDQGAVQITLPEINIWMDGNGEITLSRINRESPGRMLVSEIMILANWLMARFLAERGIPAIFRSQPAPRDRLFKDNGGNLFQNWMQRKLLNRFVLGEKPESHSGLGLEAYVTATSPIRKYFDLATQRQIRAAFGMEAPYTAEEIKRTIHALELPMSSVSRIQYQRNRYWLLKYLEKRVGQKETAVVLGKRKNGYLVLLTEYLIECMLPFTPNVSLKPEETIQVTLQHVNPRNDVIAVFLG